MGYLFYGIVRFIEAFVFYILAFFVARLLHTRLPPIGSMPFFIFIFVWPIVSTIIRPGLLTIPIIGDIFQLFDIIARSFLNKNKK